MGWRYESGFERFGNSLAGLFIGPLFVIGGMAILFWNEGNYVHTLKDIEQARHNTITLPCGADYAQVANGSFGVGTGSLVYFGGCNVTQLPSIQDQVFSQAVSSSGASVMSHSLTVSVYDQYCTSHQGRGGSQIIVCDYDLRWRSCSSDFMSSWDSNDDEYTYYKNLNARKISACTALAPNSLSPNYCSTQGYTAACTNDSILVGGTAAVSVDVIEKLSVATSKFPGNVEAIPLVNVQTVTGQGITFYRSSSANSTTPVYCTTTYCGSSFGAMEVTFNVKKFNQVSVAGKLLAFDTTKSLAVVQWKGSHGGTPMTYAALGNVSKDALFDQAQSENIVMSWVLRFVGFIVIWLGVTMFFLPAARFVAICSTCLGGVVEEMICCVTCPFALLLTLFMIGVGWVAYRPMIGAPLLAVAGLIAGLLTVRAIRQQRKSAEYYPLQ